MPSRRLRRLDKPLLLFCYLVLINIDLVEVTLQKCERELGHLARHVSACRFLQLHLASSCKKLHAVFLARNCSVSCKKLQCFLQETCKKLQCFLQEACKKLKCFLQEIAIASSWKILARILTGCDLARNLLPCKFLQKSCKFVLHQTCKFCKKRARKRTLLSLAFLARMQEFLAILQEFLQDCVRYVQVKLARLVQETCTFLARLAWDVPYLCRWLGQR